MRCELTALGREDAASYVDHRLNIARGGASTIRFSPESLNVVHHASAGVPRLINLICDRALYEAHRLGATRRVEAAIVWKALGALGLDVTPAKSPEEPGTGLIEVERPPVSQPTVPEPTVAQLIQVEVVPEPVVVAPVQAKSAKVEEPPVPAPTPVAVAVADDDSMNAFRSEAENDEASRGVEARAASRRRIRWFGFSAAAVVLLTAAVPATTWYGDEVVTALIGEVTVAPLPPAPALVAATPQRADAALAVAVSDAVGTEAVAAAPESHVEVALFGNRERAARSVEELRAGGYEAYSEDVSIGARKFVQVLAGPFPNFEDAENALALITQMPGYADARIRPEPGKN
jgi:cell division septation protein DedD